MPTAEGIFPKIGGDPLYASEVNLFNPKFIGQVDQDSVTNISGTSDYITMGGTISYSGTNTAQRIRSFLVGFASVGKREAGTTAAYSFRMRISGAGLNINTVVKTDTVTIYPTLMHVWTSGAITASGGNIGSNYVISVEGNGSTDVATAQASDFVVLGW